MFNELSIQIEKYLGMGKDFAIAQVINRISPSSGKVGDKAIILENGKLIGWIGGGCVRGIVIKEAIDVIRTKKFSRIRISPEKSTKESGDFKEYIMSCQSKGTIEVLIEPVIPQPELIIVGKSKIAQKLATVASAADFTVRVMATDSDTHMFPTVREVLEEVNFTNRSLTNTYIIVTTQGEDDELSVKKAMQSNARYVGFVASRRKTEDIHQYLRENGIPKDRIDQLRSPVGLDLNAKLASEVAISILAEIIQDFRGEATTIQSDFIPIAIAKPAEPEKPEASKFEEEFYINPVCGVPVSKKNPKHIIEYQGEKVYFCCDGCKVSFEKNPEQYVVHS